MIKSIPGWANYFILWAIYLGMTVLIDYLFHKSIHWQFDMMITAVYCGGYLAKWRFYDEGWRFW